MRPTLAAALLAGAAVLAGCSEATTRASAIEPESFPNRLSVARSFAAKPSVLGRVDMVDGGPVFTPCGQDAAYPIAQEDGWDQVARAWAVEGGLPGAPVLMDLALDLKPRESADGVSRVHVIPAGVMRLEPSAPGTPDCPERPADLAPLRAAG
ncbi:MAG: hypothetical protein AAF763_14960 [Pseudomonadota bacterium]